MISPKAYNRLTNVAAVLTVGIMGLGVLGMTGCTLEGDTYSGTVVTVDCGAADSGGGIQNCGSGSATDQHDVDNSVHGE